MTEDWFMYVSSTNSITFKEHRTIRKSFKIRKTKSCVHKGNYSALITAKYLNQVFNSGDVLVNCGVSKETLGRYSRGLKE